MSTTATTAFTAGAAGQVGGVTGQLGGVTGVFQNALGSLGRSFNILLPPAQREAMKARVSKFANEKPYLASFLLSHLALSGLPLALFFIMTVTVAIFALIAGLLVGLLGAVLFILAAVGVALVVLLPTLFFTTFAAVAVWLWGVGAYYIVKWFNQKEVPGIHKPLMDGVKPTAGFSHLQTQVASSAPQPFAKQMDTVNGAPVKGDSTGVEREEKKAERTKQANKAGVNTTLSSVPV